MRRCLLSLLLLLPVLSAVTPSPAENPLRKRQVQHLVQKFIDAYTEKWLALKIAVTAAEWESIVRSNEKPDRAAARIGAAHDSLIFYTGSPRNLDKARGFLEERENLTEAQILQLESIVYQAGESPAVSFHAVKKRASIEKRVFSERERFTYRLDGSPTTLAALEAVLRESTDLEARRAAWEAAKEIGASLRPGVAQLRRFRNDTVKGVGYRSFFHYQASEYGMKVEELMALLEGIQKELRPLYRELHTWARHELAGRYGVEQVPDLLPAHWLPDLWAQDWSGIAPASDLPISEALAKKTPEEMMRLAESFYRSLGYPALPETFWSSSVITARSAGSSWRSRHETSAWHLDLDQDVRCLMSLTPDLAGYETAHHELGHIYYYLAYSKDGVPPLLRTGANRAFHEAIGSQLGMAAMQAPVLREVGLLPAGARLEPSRLLLREALNHVAFFVFAAGTMTGFEHALYVDRLPKDRFNEKWWDLAARYQGIAPPAPREASGCDAATKSHLLEDPAQYYDYALSVLLQFQLHDHIARVLLEQDPHATRYLGSEKVGRFLRTLMETGRSRDWRTLLRETVGGDLSVEPMIRYFAPLLEHLRKENEGRRHTLSDL